MKENYTPEEGGHPYGPFGMFPPVFIVPVPRLVSAPSKVLMVSAGALHSLLLCEDQRVYSMGCAYGGRLGLGEPKTDPPEHQLCPELIDKGALSGNVRVIDISAGDSHSLAVRADGRVAAWGEGILGNGSNKSEPVLVKPLHAVKDERLKPIKDPPPIKHASAGCAHSLLVDSAGGVYSFGRGYGGCLGHGAAEEDKYIPTKIDALAHVKIKTAAAGETHSLVMDVDGRVYEFGFEDTHAIDWSDDEMDDEEEEAIPTHERGEPKLIEERNKGVAGRRWVDGAFYTNLRATDIAAGWGTSSIRSATGLIATGGGWTDSSGISFKSASWPGEDEAKMIEEVKLKDEVEVPPKPACIVM